VVAAEQLKAHGLRLTAPRVAVLETLERLPPHATVDEIAESARARIGTLSTQAVYDILHAFLVAGIVRRIEPPGSPARFETRVGDNHHHAICRVCGLTSDVDCVVGEVPCLEPGEHSLTGFRVDEAEIVFWGLCRSCQSA
jgi:Fe2+ or Zn2+ uptake regulation protein